MAWHMARSGRRVVVVDLDLEAPGAAMLLDARSDRGVIDFIVDHVASGSTSLSGCHGPARALGDEDGARVDVVPAGAMGWSYLEKLARLDYSAAGPGAGDMSPVASALSALLTAIKDELKPNFILVDSRAGLHDLGGLSLHALSHVDVLLSRASRQNIRGLELTVEALARRKNLDEDFRCIVVHSFAPLRQDGEARTDEELTLLREAYRIFTDHVYRRQPDDAPSESDDDAPHFPSVIFQHRDVERVETMAAAHESIVFGKDYGDLYQRILEQCMPED
jgi:MinD-like ATPase involved in chromosome partitioning or flagellar assembly